MTVGTTKITHLFEVFSPQNPPQSFGAQFLFKTTKPTVERRTQVIGRMHLSDGPSG